MTGVLFVGWRGALQAGRHEEECGLAAEFFRPWLMEAVNAVQQNSQVKKIPVTQLLAPLLHRLMGIAAAASLTGSDYTDGPIRIDLASVFSTTKYAAYAEMSVRQWSASLEMFLTRLQMDAERIADWLGLSEMPSIVSLAAAESDLHDAGGSVIRISFANGSNIFYKPRPVTGEFFWRELTRATEGVDAACKVASSSVLCSAGYGWMEEIPKLESPQNADRESYWRSAGSLLCHAWIAHVADLHMGNLLATQTGPAVVDAECLATPAIETDGGFDAAVLAMELSQTGLLPSRASDEPMPDVSGFFGKPRVVPAIRLPVWDVLKDGKVSLGFKSGWLKDAGNSFGDDPSIACVPALAQGFLDAAIAIQEIRPSLLQSGGWLERLQAAHAPRIVLRSTLSYGLRMSNALLSKQGEDGPVENPWIHEAERRAIDRLHVPRFVMPPGSRDLAVDREGPLVRDMFHASGSDCIRKRLERLSLAELRSMLRPALLAQML
jgi:hypothetical protein